MHTKMENVGYQPQRGHGINREAIRGAIKSAQMFAVARGFKLKAVKRAQAAIASLRMLVAR
jgi:hypothetical protein